MSKQADFHVTTVGGERDPQTFEDFMAWFEANGGGTGGSGGGIPWFGSQSPSTATSSQTQSSPTQQKSKASMDPSTALIISQLAGSLMNGIFGGSDSQERQSFEGKGSISPEAMMRSNQALLGSFSNALTDRMASPVSLPSAYAQQPGVYTGGGMPFPIGLVATDPAVSNPSLLSRPGMTGFSNVLSGLNLGDPGGQPTFPSHTNPPGTGIQPGDAQGEDFFGYNGDTGAFDNFYQPGFDQRTDQNRQGTTDGAEPRQGNAAEGSTGPRRRIYREGENNDYGQLVRAEDLGLTSDQNPGDDLKQAMGAVDLLMQAYGGR